MHEETLRRAYGAFNARNIDALLALMQPEVRWANGAGGFVTGKEDLRAYWSQQWNQADPHFEPLRFTVGRDGRLTVEVRQLALDPDGDPLSETSLQHVFRFRDGLVKSMEIRA